MPPVTDERALLADVEAALQRLDAWHAGLATALDALCLDHQGLSETGALAKSLAEVDAIIAAERSAWPSRRAAREPARALAGLFEDVTILLVFGKLNAGKSSLCNFIADRFLADGSAVSYFHLDAAGVVVPSERLLEGATETTARLQGVRLGRKLVLLDTPGLHSMTPENAALTRRFTDSADAVLWLTSSASPGQVQELDELLRELRRGKPLLPIITRSDVYEEDEIAGELVRRLRNKSVENRALQEADVTRRAADKFAILGLDPAQLEPPLSLSVSMARQQGETAAALDAAGVSRLWAAFAKLAAPASAYKMRKRPEMLLHHLQEDVWAPLERELGPGLERLQASVRAERAGLEARQERLVAMVWRRVVPVLPDLLDAYAAGGDEGRLDAALSEALHTACGDAGREHFPDYQTLSVAVSTAVDPSAGQVLGRLATHDYARLYVAMEQWLQDRVQRWAEIVAEQARTTLNEVLDRIDRIQEMMRAKGSDLHALTTQLRLEGGGQAMDRRLETRAAVERGEVQPEA